MHQADALATSIHTRAEAAARPRLPMEIQALQNLHILADSAKYFHEQVERNAQTPSYAQQEYTNLYNSYVQARRTWAWVSANQVLQKDFDQFKFFKSVCQFCKAKLAGRPGFFQRKKPNLFYLFFID